jgi:hypothetical protein
MIVAAFVGSMMPAFAAADSFLEEDGSFRTIGEALADERILVVREALDAWNAKSLSFPTKQALEPYVLAFREPLNCPGQEPRYEMRNVSLDSWAQLPETLAPTLPIDTGSQLFLLGLVEGNLPVLADLDAAQFSGQLMRSLYLVLGTAQLRAQNAGATQIRTGYLWSAMLDYPFMAEPFNPAVCPRDPSPQPPVE